MLEYRVQGDISEIEKHLSRMGRDQVPFATALALTRTVKFAQKKVVEEIPRVFDRPTRYTQNSTFIEPARKNKLWALLKIKDDPTGGGIVPIKFLKAEIFGGQRARKGFERRLIAAGKMPPNAFAVPTSFVALDAYGNVPRSQLTKIVSDLQAQFDATANSTARSRLRRRRSRTKRPTFYFSTWPPSPRTQKLKPGIYIRSEFGFGSSIKPVFLFVSRATYRRRLRFYEIADQAARSRFKIEFALAMRQALATAFR